MIIATKYKMSTLTDHFLRIDSRDPTFDAQFAGLYRVIVDFAELQLVDVKAD